jgi:hypothetical protein
MKEWTILEDRDPTSLGSALLDTVERDGHQREKRTLAVRPRWNLTYEEDVDKKEVSGNPPCRCPMLALMIVFLLVVGSSVHTLLLLALAKVCDWSNRDEVF